MEINEKSGSVILPGSYDPITLGHLNVLEKAVQMYGKVYIVAFRNPQKTYMFSDDERLTMLRICAQNYKNVIADISRGRVVDYMKEHGITRIVKGIRSEADLAYEEPQARYNLEEGGYETEYFYAQTHLDVSSTLARERIRSGGDLSGILDPRVIDFIKKR